MPSTGVALLGLALLDHDVDFLAGLDLYVALVVLDLGNRNQSLGLEADVNHDVGGGDLQDRALDDAVFMGGLLGRLFGGEVFQCGCEVVRHLCFVSIRRTRGGPKWSNSGSLNRIHSVGFLGRGRLLGRRMFCARFRSRLRGGWGFVAVGCMLV